MNQEEMLKREITLKLPAGMVEVVLKGISELKVGEGVQTFIAVMQQYQAQMNPPQQIAKDPGSVGKTDIKKAPSSGQSA